MQQTCSSPNRRVFSSVCTSRVENQLFIMPSAGRRKSVIKNEWMNQSNTYSLFKLYFNIISLESLQTWTPTRKGFHKYRGTLIMHYLVTANWWWSTNSRSNQLGQIAEQWQLLKNSLRQVHRDSQPIDRSLYRLSYPVPFLYHTMSNK
jgi:hypothetical protein